MASSKDKALWSGSGFQSRTSAERTAYRAKIKANLRARYETAAAREAQEKINEAHAAWVAAGMPEPAAN